MDLIGNNKWAQFQSIIKNANDTFGQAIVIWRRSKGGLDFYGEDNSTEEFEDIELKGLFNHNFFRTWPITFTTEGGELDRQNTVLILNVDYLIENGWADEYNRLKYDAAADRFIYNGLVHKAMGDSEISQAKDGHLLFQLILKREEKQTGTE